MTSTTTATGATPTAEHADGLRRHGYALVQGFLSPSELARVHEELATIVPAGADVRSDPERHGNGVVRHRFPFEIDSLNEIIVRDDVIDFCARTIGSENLAMSD